MEIKVEDYDVFKDGSIITMGKEIGFTIRIVFKTDFSSGTNIFAEKFDKVGAKLNFINFNIATGLGNIEPVRIGTYNNRELLLTIGSTLSSNAEIRIIFVN